MASNTVDNQKPTLCIDFDGVIYLPNEKDFAFDKLEGSMVPKAKESIEKLSQFFTVVILSARARRPEGKKAIQGFLSKEGISCSSITDKKPPAAIYLDDRGLQFSGNWDKTVDDIANFKHWFSEVNGADHSNDNESKR